MNLIKLDNRFTMKKYGFECMLEWTNVEQLQYNGTHYNLFYKIRSAAQNTLGPEWSQYFTLDGKWLARREDSKAFARIYFRNEKYITLVQMAQ